MTSEKKKLAGKIAGWIATAAAIIGAFTQAYYQTQEAKQDAAQAEVKTEASYETLAPIIDELQDIIEEDHKWADDVDTELDVANERVRNLELTLARHEALFEILKSQSPRLARAPEPRVEMPPPRASMDRSVTTTKPKLGVPKTLDQAMKQQKKIDF